MNFPDLDYISLFPIREKIQGRRIARPFQDHRVWSSLAPFLRPATGP